MIQQKHRALLYRLAEWSLLEADSTDKAILRVQNVVQYLQDAYPRSLRTFLRHYWLCLRKIYLQNHLQIEYVGKLPQKSAIEALFEKISTRIVYQENPQLIGGVKMQHGDWIWDQSVRGELNELMRNLKTL